LWVRKGVLIDGYLVGGSQERRRRAGTENVPALVGLGGAAAPAPEGLPPRGGHLASFRGPLEAGGPGDPRGVRRPGPVRGGPAAAQPLDPRPPRGGRPGAPHPVGPRGLRGLDRSGLRLRGGRAEPDPPRLGPPGGRGALLAPGELRPREPEGGGGRFP